eukprot:scaffold60791_cov60-Phaeocystis_antarctica.AAC.1
MRGHLASSGKGGGVWRTPIRADDPAPKGHLAGTPLCEAPLIMIMIERNLWIHGTCTCTPRLLNKLPPRPVRRERIARPPSHAAAARPSLPNSKGWPPCLASLRQRTFEARRTPGRSQSRGQGQSEGEGRGEGEGE